MADAVGQADLRAENVDRVIKGLALQEYKFKDLCLTFNTNVNWYHKNNGYDLIIMNCYMTDNINKRTI